MPVKRLDQRRGICPSKTPSDIMLVSERHQKGRSSQSLGGNNRGPAYVHQLGSLALKLGTSQPGSTLENVMVALLASHGKRAVITLSLAEECDLCVSYFKLSDSLYRTRFLGTYKKLHTAAQRGLQRIFPPNTLTFELLPVTLDGFCGLGGIGGLLAY